MVVLADVAFWRDIVIIVGGILAAVLLFVLILFTVVLGVATRVLLGTLRHLLESEVTPLTQSARQTAVQVRGTVVFVSETAVTPIVRTYGAVAGVRRVLGVLSGVSRRARGSRQG
jgi:hypothetical protein